MPYYQFNANMEIDGRSLSLGISNILLRGCKLKNTGWAVGVVVYAGCETQAIHKRSSVPSKRSRLETRKNVEISILFLFLSVLCIVVSVCSAVWLIRKGDGLDILPYFRNKDFSKDPPETYKYYGRGLDAFLAFLMSAIVLQIMVPISLYISMDLVRLGQAYFMIRDAGMYDETTNSGLQCQALSMNEDLGQIRHVFSNITGTLIENKIEFRCASIGGINYEGERTNPIGEQIGYTVQVNGKVLRPKKAVKINSELLGLLKNGKHTNEENAISIGYSSGLLTNEMPQIKINIHSVESCRRILENAAIMSKKFASVSGATLDVSGKSTEIAKNSIALIIDGDSLTYIRNRDLKGRFLELACCCSVVLFFRVDLFEKATIVGLVKEKTSDMILAIGGLNDVPMLEMADVGIGICSKEGQEAVMASDFVVGQFRFLVPLLLVHGHWNYQRMGYMILHTFYRNVVFVFVLFWYLLFTSFSLTSAINQWSNVLYSVISTCLPSIAVGILDQDFSRRTLLRYPQLYGAGYRQEGYNSKLFWLTMIDAVWQSIIIFFIPLLAYWATTIDVSSLGDLWLLALVIVVNLHLAMDIVRWNFIIHAVIWGSIFATVISVIVLDSLVSLPGYWAIYHVAGTVSFWLCLLAIIVVALLPRFVVKYVYHYWSLSDIQIAREVDKFGTIGELGDVQTSNRDDCSPQ